MGLLPEVQSGPLVYIRPNWPLRLHYLAKYFSACELCRPGVCSYAPLPSMEDKSPFVVLRELDESREMEDSADATLAGTHREDTGQ